MKYCSKCKTGKNNSDFKKDKTVKDGLFFWCLKCSHKFSHLIKKCSFCGVSKNISLFQINKGSKDGVSPTCRDCKSTRVQTFKKFIKQKQTLTNLTEEQNDYLKELIKRKKHDAKSKSVKFDFNFEWAKEQFLNGCSVTGIPFEISNPPTPFSLEVDRITPDGDYSMENSRFVCAIFNRIKWNFTDDDMFKMTLSLVINNWEQYKKYLHFAKVLDK